jgi:NADH-quinone oxidoreductase subunit J
VHAAFSLLLTFCGVSGLYVLLGADFIAIVQIIVYVGGIMILLLFGVMLTNRITNVEIKSGTIQIIPAVIGIAFFMALLVSIMYSTDWKVVTGSQVGPTAYALGQMIVTDYVLIFELLGILLLVALIGAASIARRDQE